MGTVEIRVGAKKPKVRWMLPLLAAASVSAAGVDSPNTREVIASYGGIGRIQWMLPESFNFRSSAKEFSRGQRIRCTDGRQECAIGINVRDITTVPEKRRQELADKLKPFIAHSAEGSLRYRTRGADDELVYATLTDTRSDKKYRLITMGYRLAGPGVIYFEHYGNEPAQIIRMLDVVSAARALDAREMWAWKLTDYKVVCQERFPEFQKANAAAYASSVFASADVVGFFQAIVSSGPERVQAQIEKSRASYAAGFDREPAQWRRDFCEHFPYWVSQAARGISQK